MQPCDELLAYVAHLVFLAPHAKLSKKHPNQKKEAVAHSVGAELHFVDIRLDW